MIETLNTTSAGQSTLQGSAAQSEGTSNSSTLGQQDFLTLMTEQLKNQDPLAPMENGEFLAQMAQFSTVSGIEELNKSITEMATGMRDFRMSTAANLLGHQVLVPNDTARSDENGVIGGVAELPESAASVTVKYLDPETGELLHSEALGRTAKGTIGFSWDDAPAKYKDERAPVRIEVSMTDSAGESRELTPSVYAKVVSARSGGDGQGVMLQVEDYGAISAQDIGGFR